MSFLQRIRWFDAPMGGLKMPINTGVAACPNRRIKRRQDRGALPLGLRTSAPVQLATSKKARNLKANLPRHVPRTLPTIGGVGALDIGYVFLIG